MTRNYSKSDLATLSTEGLGAKLPEPKARKKRKNEEGEMQRALMTWWHGYSQDKGIPECLLFAIPNGSALGHGKEEYQVKQRQIRGRLMKLEGLRPGVCDLLLAVPSKLMRSDDVYASLGFAIGRSHGLFIEMKLPNGTVSMDQVVFISHAKAHGYQAAICRSLDEAIKIITNYLT